MLYIGAIFGGPEAMSTSVASAISRIQHRLAEPSEPAAGETGSLDIVFHVGGSLIRPDYEGVRTGSLWRKKRTLQVQIAVPPGLDEMDEGEIESSLIGLLRDAVQAARPVFEKARISFPHERYEQLVAAPAAGMSKLERMVNETPRRGAER